MRKPLFFLALVLLSFTLLSARSRAEGLTGPWEGTLTLLGGELKIIVHLEEGDAGLTGTIDIPNRRFGDLDELPWESSISNLPLGRGWPFSTEFFGNEPFRGLFCKQA